MEINTVNEQKSCLVAEVKLELPTKRSPIKLQAYVIDKIMTLAPMQLKNGQIFNQHHLNDPSSTTPRRIDVLIGVNGLMKIVSGIETRVAPQIFLMSTPWGKIPSGFLPVDRTFNKAVVLMTSTERIARVLEKSWKIEELPRDNASGNLSSSELDALERINEVLKFNKETKTYETDLIWKQNPDLINNYHNASVRLETLLRKLRKNEELKGVYCDAMNDYIKGGVVEEVTDESARDVSRKDVYYLPHRAVYDPQRVSTKCRIVYDASAVTPTKKSLNMCLHAGPPLQLDIVAVELRFRLHPIALIGDISKMFLQIKVRETSRDYLRFLWKEPESKSEARIFRFKTLIFGATDSPFQAITCVQRLAKEAMENASASTRHACHVLQNDTYVDDITTGASSVKEALVLYNELTQLLGSRGFTIKKWCSNSADVLKHIPEKLRAPTEVVRPHNGLLDNEEISTVTSTLGIQWLPSKDEFVFQHFSDLHKENNNTKTSVASLIAKLYDPLGFLSPYVLQARVIMKETFVRKINWKEQLPNDLKKQWIQWVEKLPKLAMLTFPRFVPTNNDSEIHIFCDASLTGYGIAAYMRTFQAQKKRYESKLLMARAKIAPMKELTIPRLELKALYLGAQIALFLTETLRWNKSKVICWSDSEIALWWLTKDSSTLVPFVANRVEFVQKSEFAFRHIPTDKNPADLASRGTSPASLSSEFWRKGPAFLQLHQSQWPKFKPIEPKSIYTEGVKKQKVFTLAMNTIRTEEGFLHQLLSRYSSYHKLINVTALLLKSISKFKKSKEELPFSAWTKRANFFWIRQEQEDLFPEEMDALKKANSVAQSSPLASLAPFLDKKGLMRVGGRIGVSQLSYAQKHPLVLSKSSKYVKLLVHTVHLDNSHATADWMHFHLRQTYWILSSRILMRSQVYNCLRCKRLNARRTSQLMSQLPMSRVTQAEPFTHVGVDLTGALTLKHNLKERVVMKAYIVLFSCMVTRAVHLELVLSNRTEEFLMAFKRMINVRGFPQDMYSDNAKYFIRADKEITESFATLVKKTSQSAQFRCKWHFATELSAHGNGVWERSIGLMKKSLFATIGNALLTYTEMLTVLKQCEGMLNDRPLVTASEDSFEALTPAKLLMGKAIRPWTDFFEDSILPQKMDFRERWKIRNQAATRFWRMWSTQYLTALQQRNKWQTPNPNLDVGDVVIFEKHNIKKAHWPLARVMAVRKGRDGLVRSVKLLVAEKAAQPGETSWITRSIHDIVPLESKLPN